MTIPIYPTHGNDSLLSRLTPTETAQFLYEMTVCMNRLRNADDAFAPEVPSEPVRQEPLTGQIRTLLLKIGVPPQVRGFRYLTEAVRLAVTDPDCINHMTHLLYPSVAKKLGVPASGVERGIRHAVKLAWVRQKPGILDELLGRSVISAYEKPTNSELIASLAEFLTRNREEE